MQSPRRDRAVLAAVVFAVLLAQVLLYPGVSDLVAALGATTSLDASMWFLTAEFVAFVAFAGVWGLLSDVTGRRTSLVAAGAIGGAVGYLALAGLGTLGSVSFAEVLVLRAAQGAATIGALSLAMATLSDLPGGHGRNMGAAGIAIGLGTAIGAPLGGQLTTISPTLPLYLAAGVLLVAGLLALLASERPPTDGRTRIAEVWATLRTTPELSVPFAFGFVDRLTAGFFALVGTYYFRHGPFGLDAGETGLVLALFFAPFALLQYPFGVLADRIGRVAPVAGGSACYGLVVVGVGLAPTLAGAQALMVAAGVLGALMAPATMALVTDLAEPRSRGTAMSGFNVFGSLGFLVGIVVGGTVADAWGYPAAFAVVGVLELLLVVAALPRLLALDLPTPSAASGD